MLRRSWFGLLALMIPVPALVSADDAPAPDTAPFMVWIDDQLVASVVTGDDAQSPYVYPLLGPGGVRMTRGFPMDPRPGDARDHPHHRSLWLAHGNVNGVDFWHEGDRHGRIVTLARRTEDREDGAVVVELDLSWESDVGPLLNETRRLVFASQPTSRTIDVESTFTALDGPVTFGDTKEGMMAIRMHPAFRLDGDATGTVRNSEGVEDAAVWGRRARWVHYRGVIGDAPMGIVLFDHPGNLRHPTWWHARTYGLAAANPFGVHDFENAPPGTGDFTLAARERLTLRYRVLVHAGERTADEIELDFKGFADVSDEAAPDS